MPDACLGGCQVGHKIGKEHLKGALIEFHKGKGKPHDQKGSGYQSPLDGIEQKRVDREYVDVVEHQVAGHQGDEAIMDYKNARQDKGDEDIDDYKMQLTAYARCHNELFGTNIKKGVIMMMCRSGRYKEFILEGKEFQEVDKKWWKLLEEYYTKFGIQMP